METLSKRKRRKTRKCLDEIRKRSRQNGTDKDVAAHKSSNSNNCIKVVKTINNNCITSNRLTLAMFPKAIRSETITRPALAEIQNKKIIPVAKQINQNTNDLGVKNSIIFKFSDNADEETEKELLGSCTSPLSFCSINQEDKFTPQIKLSPNRDTVSTASTSMDSSNVQPAGYHLYRQFLDNLSSNLMENMPTLIKNDVITKTKTYLQRIYINSCQKKYTNSMSIRHKGLDLNPPVDKNPISYIKFGCSDQQDEPMRTSISPTHSPIELSSTPTSSTPQADSSVVETDTPLRLSIILDTPEYNYFPHKLN